jgi:hypothetical protein
MTNSPLSRVDVTSGDLRKAIDVKMVNDERVFENEETSIKLSQDNYDECDHPRTFG